MWGRGWTDNRPTGTPLPSTFLFVAARHLSLTSFQLFSDASLQSTRTSFASTLSSALWFLTTGIQFILVWWYRKSAVVWLPKGYVAGGLGWWFSFPSAPKGELTP